MASMPTGRPEADKATVRIGIRRSWCRADTDGNAGSRVELVDFPVRQRSAVGGRDRQPTVLWNQDRGTWDFEHGPDGVDDRLEQIVHRSLLHQELGQLVEAVRLDRPPLGVGSGGLEAGDDSSHQQHHDHVDAERYPVICSTDRKRVVGRGEHVVVDEESGGDAGHASREPAGDDSGNHRYDQDQRQGGRAGVRPDRHHRRTESNREDDAHHRADKTFAHPSIFIRSGGYHSIGLGLLRYF